MMTKEMKKEILQWDVKTWGKALNYWEKEIDWNTVTHTLELGANRGGLSLWLSLKGKQHVCSDLENAKDKAFELHEKHGVSQRITYVDINATSIPYENHFDLIVFKSMITSIGHNANSHLQHRIFREIHKALKPGGKLLFAENLSGSRLHRYLRKKYIPWSQGCRYFSSEEMKTFLQDFSSYSFKTTGVLATLGRNESQRNFLATIDQVLLNAVCPGSWKYMGYGVATK